MKQTLLMLVCAFALYCSPAMAQDEPSSNTTQLSLGLIEFFDPALNDALLNEGWNKDSVYAIKVCPETAEFMQLLTTITLAGDVPPKINYFFQPKNLARFVIAPRVFEYPAYIGTDYYECDYEYGRVQWYYNLHTQRCENVKIALKGGTKFYQIEQLYDIEQRLVSLGEDVKHKRLYDFPVINFRDKSQLDKLPPQVFGFLLAQDFQYDSVWHYYKITINPGMEATDEMFALLNKIARKTKGSTRLNTYQLVTPTMNIPIQEVIGSYYYQVNDKVSWYANKGNVFQVHIYVNEEDMPHLVTHLALTQHLLSLVAKDIQQDKWTVDNHL